MPQLRKFKGKLIPQKKWHHKFYSLTLDFVGDMAPYQIILGNKYFAASVHECILD